MATVSDTNDGSNLPQNEFHPEPETTTDAALDETTNQEDAEVAGFQPSAGLFTQVKRQLPVPGAAFSHGNPPPISNAGNLPGAFFFLTLTYHTGQIAQVVAYDPWVKAADKLADIQAFYKANPQQNLPYYEYFDQAAAGPWKQGDNKYYSGTYATSAASKGAGSPNWYYTGVGGNPIANGVNIAFWNQKPDAAGLFTSSPTQKFDKTSTTLIMTMYAAGGTSIIPEGSKFLKAGQVDFYARIGSKLS